MNKMESASKHEYGFCASIPGHEHIRYDIPCLEASLIQFDPRPGLIVCEGMADAPMSHLGVRDGVHEFRHQLGILEPWLSGLLDEEEKRMEEWERICQILCRSFLQVEIELSERHRRKTVDFKFGVSFAVVGKRWIGCFQLATGSIVVRENGTCRNVFLSDEEKSDSRTEFVGSEWNRMESFRCTLLSRDSCSGVAITSDGTVGRMFVEGFQVPGPEFNNLFNRLRTGTFFQQDLMDYLTSKEWFDVPGGNDDRSMAILNLSEAKNVKLLAEESFLLQREKSEKRLSIPEKETDNRGNKAIPDRVFPFGESCIRALLVVVFLTGGFGFLGYRIQQIQQERNIQKEEFRMLEKIIRKRCRELQRMFPEKGVKKNECSVNPAL